jgi:ribosomal protein S18 acetylase RimI-like enzyme
MPLEFAFLSHDDPRLEDERDLRFRVLRAPLGFTRADVTVDHEDESMHLVAIDEGRVVGCVMLTPKGTKLGKLRQMAVDPSRQGTGLGRALVLHLEASLRERGFEEVELHARDHAVGFYEKLGYVKEGELFVEVHIPHLRMRKRL